MKVFLLIVPLLALTFIGASTAPLPVRLDDGLNGVFGKHPGFRAAHAKGVVLRGTFTPSTSAPSITKAAFLQHTTPVPITVRFSDGAGTPLISDADPSGTPRGMAIKYQLPGDATMDTVTFSVPFFAVRTGEDFATLLNAIAASGPTAPKPTALDTFLASHPVAKAFLTYNTPPPVSFGTLAYYGVNAFRFTDAKGVVRYGRYLYRPVAGVHYLPMASAKTLAPNYLMDEIVQRVHKAPVVIDFYVQMAGKGDDINNPTKPWPISRPLVKLGTVVIRTAVPDSLAAQKKLLFLPSTVPGGIEPADPMIQIRSAEYGVSFGRRSVP